MLAQSSLLLQKANWCMEFYHEILEAVICMLAKLYVALLPYFRMSLLGKFAEGLHTHIYDGHAHNTELISWLMVLKVCQALSYLLRCLMCLEACSNLVGWGKNVWGKAAKGPNTLLVFNLEPSGLCCPMISAWVK